MLNKYKFLSVLSVNERFSIRLFSFFFYIFEIVSILSLYFFIDDGSLFYLFLFIVFFILHYLLSLEIEERFFVYICKYKDKLLGECVFDDKEE